MEPGKRRRRGPLRCCLCGRIIIPGLEMWTTVNGICRPCHRDCGVPAAQARPEREIHHLEWKYSTRKMTRRERKAHGSKSEGRISDVGPAH